MKNLKSYQELIKGDTFNESDEYFVDANLFKMCWGCETKHKSGHMVWDVTKMRRIFFCEECFKSMKK